MIHIVTDENRSLYTLWIDEMFIAQACVHRRDGWRAHIARWVRVTNYGQLKARRCIPQAGLAPPGAHLFKRVLSQVKGKPSACSGVPIQIPTQRWTGRASTHRPCPGGSMRLWANCRGWAFEMTHNTHSFCPTNGLFAPERRVRLVVAPSSHSPRAPLRS